jgi:hypothetical protein
MKGPEEIDLEDVTETGRRHRTLAREDPTGAENPGAAHREARRCAKERDGFVKGVLDGPVVADVGRHETDGVPVFTGERAPRLLLHIEDGDPASASQDPLHDGAPKTRSSSAHDGVEILETHELETPGRF